MISGHYLQRVANVSPWETEYALRTVRPNPISVRAHHIGHCALLTSFLRHMIYKGEASYKR
jgi:hypothetical protein